MKIEIDLMDNGIPYYQQMEAVDLYIKGAAVKIDNYDYFAREVVKQGDVTLFSKLTLKTTNKDEGCRVETSHRNFHVSCKRTKGGIYKFKVWQAV